MAFCYAIMSATFLAPKAMPKITVPAAKIEQDGKVLFLTRFTVADLITPGFYGVPELVGRERPER